MISVVDKLKWKLKMVRRSKEFSTILDRQNVFDISDVGSDDYVINIIDENNIIEKENCYGELFIACASNRYKVKQIPYKLTYGEKNRMVLSVREELEMTELETIAIERYVTNFCVDIKKQLEYKVDYSVKEVKNEMVENKVSEKIENKAEETVVLAEKNRQKESNVFTFDNITNAIKKSGERSLMILAYIKDGNVGVMIDSAKGEIAEIEISKNEILSNSDKQRTLSSAICMAQAIGPYIRYKDDKNNVRYFFYQDEDVFEKIPEQFNNVSENKKEVCN